MEKVIFQLYSTVISVKQLKQAVQLVVVLLQYAPPPASGDMNSHPEISAPTS